MAGKALFLSEEDREILRKMIEDSRRRVVSLTTHFQETELGQAQENYISRSPPGGIPGMRIENIGGQLYVIPGSAECKIYSILKDRGPVRISEVPDQTKIVFNPDPDDIKENTWLLITKDKLGDWVVAEIYSETSTGTWTATGTGTGTGSHHLHTTGTGTGTGTGIPIPPTPPENSIEFMQYDLECEDGILNKYGRTVTIKMIRGELERVYGSWFFVSQEGCCECAGTGTHEWHTTGTGSGIPFPPYTGTGTGYPYLHTINCQDLASKTNLYLSMEVYCEIAPFGYACPNCENDIGFNNQRMLKNPDDFEWLTGEITEGDSTNIWGLQCFQGPQGPEWSFYSATSVCFDYGNAHWELRSARISPFEMDWILKATGQGNTLSCPHCTPNMNLTMVAKIRENVV